MSYLSLFHSPLPAIAYTLEEDVKKREAAVFEWFGLLAVRKVFPSTQFFTPEKVASLCVSLINP